MFSAYLEFFEQHEPLRQRVLYVLNTLPKEVQPDFLSDLRFTVSLNNYVPGEGKWYSWPPRKELARAAAVWS
jgi:hypothetical protein|tara:strand:- start:187 stop:402 length:216 start_codon:yes stop_codon:yes gene_type:complete